ncbi:MAG: hypothetical protein QY326_06685 [Bdellovibrionota bacterium]|nr:MAG: hypothetical protein QY326_06685 [Bdellovibrionota bacterium]
MTSKEMPAPVDAAPDQDDDLDRRNDALQRALVEDPLVRFVQKRWRALAVVVLFIAAGIYVRNAFVETHEAALRSSGDLFAKIRTEYGLIQAQRAQLTELAMDQSEEGKKKLEAQQNQIKDAEAGLVNALATLSDSKEPYASVALLYKALMQAEPSTAAPSENLAPDNPRLLLVELALLLEAKRLLDHPEQRAEGQAKLQELARSARFVHAVAAISYAHVAESSEERTTARNLLDGVRVMHPEQSDLISAELDRLNSSGADQ